MAIDIKFDLANNPEPPTILLANRSGNIYGQLNVDETSIEINDKFDEASEISFTLYKYIDDKIDILWDKVIDFKLIYCKEWDKWFEITVEVDESNEVKKTVFGTQLEYAELSQIMLYDIEINTENDIARDDYIIPTVLYRKNGKVNEGITKEEHDIIVKSGINATGGYKKYKEASLLHRILADKAPHYHIMHVDGTIKKIQRTFTFNGTSICDALKEIGEEIGCLFVLSSVYDKNGILRREIRVYDLQDNCESCGHRGEFSINKDGVKECPKCKNTNVKKGYGEDTLIFVTSDELASEGIQLTTDVESVKSCFKLESGDDLMTATVRNCNPNGTDYIWYFSSDVGKDMSDRLFEKIKRYQYIQGYYLGTNDKPEDFDVSMPEMPLIFKDSNGNNLFKSYNKLVEKYKKSCLNCGKTWNNNDEDCPYCGSEDVLINDDLEKIDEEIYSYPSLMRAYYNITDLSLYLESGLMPNVKMDGTTAENEAIKLKTDMPYEIGVSNANIASDATANNAVLAMAKIIVRPTYKVEILNPNDRKLDSSKKWTGKFIITNYSDEKDTYTTEQIEVKLVEKNETIIRQAIEKALNKENTDNLNITGLFKLDDKRFKTQLKKYSLNYLSNIQNACETCIDILIERGAGNVSNKDLYEGLYLPYYNKSKYINEEMKNRESELKTIEGKLDSNGKVISKGLKDYINEAKLKVNNALNLENYLGDDWLEFCSYRREEKYSNENYISDGLSNKKIFENALEFIDIAKNEIRKASESKYSISTTLNNLLAIEKFKPLVDSFKVGNRIMIQVDDDIYTLRLIEYNLSYGSFNNIYVIFSDVTKIKNSATYVKDTLAKSLSVASTYNTTRKLANQGNKAKNTIEQWETEGLDSTSVKIYNNENKEVVIGNGGLLGRSYDDITESYSQKQIKITNNTLAYTEDSWESVNLAIGEYSYETYNEDEDKWVNKNGYGIRADFLDAGVVKGSTVIGGIIYSDNYSKTNADGSYLNLKDGTFSFAGGALTFDGKDLKVNSPDIQQIVYDTVNGEWLSQVDATAEKLKINAENIQGQLGAYQIDASELKINAKNIQGRLIAEQIDTSELIAKNISDRDITNKVITNSSFTSIGKNNEDNEVKIEISNGQQQFYYNEIQIGSIDTNAQKFIIKAIDEYSINIYSENGHLLLGASDINELDSPSIIVGNGEKNVYINGSIYVNYTDLETYIRNIVNNVFNGG